MFTAKVRGALRLSAVDPHAHALGIRPGLTLADVRACHRDLQVAAMDEDADHHWLGQLARRCICWSPLVALVPPDAITIDITGADHLFGGEAALTSQVEESLSSIGMTIRLACAATAQAAQALARHARLPVDDEGAAIRALPVAALGMDAEATLALHRAGLRHIGDVAARPFASIAARFGMDAVTALRRLMGEEQAPIDPLRPPERLYFERRFAEPVGLQASLMSCFAELLHQAARTMETARLGGRRFSMTLQRSDGARHQLSIETGLPTRDPALVLRLLDERIATLADPLDPGFGYDSITLSVPVTEALAASQPTFDGNGRAATALAELIDRLSTRLGPGSLRRLAPRDSHMPERSQQALPAVQFRDPVVWPQAAAGEPPMRPLFLFDPPQGVEVIAEVPDGPPLRFRWRGKLHEVHLHEGPERIASEWWRRTGGEQDGKGGLTRDYFRIEDTHGRRYWMFRHGLYEERADPRWYLHGLFA